MVKMNVKITHYGKGNNPFSSVPGDWGPWDRGTLTYQHGHYLEEGTVVRVDCEGYQALGEISFTGKSYDGPCKPILEVVSQPTAVVCV